MTLTLVFLAFAAVAAVFDWIAVATDRTRLESVAKPMVMLMLVATVASDSAEIASVLVAAALGFSAIGDVLLLPHVDRFISGLSAFLVAHGLFVGAFLVSISEVDVLPVVLGSAVAIVAIMMFGGTIISAARRQDSRLGTAVSGYIAVLGIMVVASFATGAPIAAAGAVLFAGSDAVLGWNRFVRSSSNARLLTHIPYHLGQGTIALWALALT